jgi:hypothetical protein
MGNSQHVNTLRTISAYSSMSFPNLRFTFNASGKLNGLESFSWGASITRFTFIANGCIICSTYYTPGYSMFGGDDEPREFCVIGFSTSHNAKFAKVLLSNVVCGLLNVSIIRVVNPDAGSGLRSAMFGGTGLFGKEDSSWWEVLLAFALGRAMS